MRYTKPFAIALLLNLATAAIAEDLFTAKIEPLLKQRCYECHSHGKKMKGGLTLDSKAGWEKGGDSGPAIIPGDTEQSLLIEMIRWGDKAHQMPPDKPLAAAEIAIFEDWIKRGAPDPRLPTSADKSGDWWSLRPLPSSESHRSEVLKLSKSGPSPIDLLIQKKLQENGLKPSPEADRRTLIRRLTFDLHGLPPTIENVNE
ncbi:MAG: c-type cytochrome domain-containing protein, partial [Methylococcaceae bacterium]